MNIGNMLHTVSSVAKEPVLWLLIILLIITAFITGSLISEVIFRRKRRKTVTEMIELIADSKISDLEKVIKSGNFTAVQQRAFLDIIKTGDLSDAMRTEAAQGAVTAVENHYSRIINYSEMVVKIAPMAGLMGTLIPLGPGLMALGQGDMETLSESLVTAFDTTVAGLISAGFASVISSIRKLWYKKDIADTEAILETLLEKMHTEVK